MNEYVEKIVEKEELSLSQQAIEALEKLRLGESVDESLLTPDDQNKIGYCFYYGKNLTQNYHNAFHWYTLSANRDFPPAERNLGICYEKGHGVQHDEKLSAYWFERAASHGNADAQSEIAERYYVGNGVEKDEERAWEWMEKAIKTSFDKKEPVLLNYLGDRHHYGDGMFEQNLDVAAMFYKKASDFGLPLGSLNSAAMILYGEADGTDEELEKFLSDAAEADLPMAQKWLDMLREKIEMDKGLTK